MKNIVLVSSLILIICAFSIKANDNKSPPTLIKQIESFHLSKGVNRGTHRGDKCYVTFRDSGISMSSQKYLFSDQYYGIEEVFFVFPWGRNKTLKYQFVLKHHYINQQSFFMKRKYIGTSLFSNHKILSLSIKKKKDNSVVVTVKERKQGQVVMFLAGSSVTCRIHPNNLNRN